MCGGICVQEGDLGIKKNAIPTGMAFFLEGQIPPLLPWMKSILYNLLCHCIDFLGKTRFLACRSVLMIDVVGGCLVDGFICCDEEGFRLVRIACSDSIIDAADGAAHTCLFSDVARTALGIRLYTQNGSLDIWQMVHPPQRKMYWTILAYRCGNCNVFFAFLLFSNR